MFRHTAWKPILFVVAATAAIACDAQVTPITWSQATPAQTQVAVATSMSLGISPALELAALAQADHEQDSKCPTMWMKGSDTQVFQGENCTSRSGRIYNGRVEKTVRGEAAKRATELQFDGFSVVTTRGKLVIDGTVDESAIEASSNITLQKDDVVMHFEASVSCVTRSECKTNPASHASIDGLGDFTIDLQVFEDARKNVLALKGTDELRLSPSSDADGCIPYTINDKAAPTQRICK